MTQSGVPAAVLLGLASLTSCQRASQTGLEAFGDARSTPAQSAGATPTPVSPGPAKEQGSSPGAPVAANVGARTAIIADHRAVQEFDRIPESWITKAKALSVHIATTSHGAQITEGIWPLAERDPRFAYTKKRDDSGQAGPKEAGKLRIYEGNGPCQASCQANCTAYPAAITPDQYWDSPCGLERTRAVLDTGAFDLTLWAWCTEQSQNTPEQVDRYLARLGELDAQYPKLRVVYLTGVVDPASDKLARNNQRIRDHVAKEGLILYDFADIERHAPDGTEHPTTTERCDWCPTWCAAHPADCANLPDNCPHAHPFACLVKAKAFWWLLARAAGWPGIPG